MRVCTIEGVTKLFPQLEVTAVTRPPQLTRPVWSQTKVMASRLGPRPDEGSGFTDLRQPDEVSGMVGKSDGLHGILMMESSSCAQLDASPPSLKGGIMNQRPLPGVVQVRSNDRLYV